MSGGRERVIIGAASKPALRRHARMQYDAARDRWIIMAPERVLEPDAIALAVLRLCDGSRTVDAIGEELARTYAADERHIAADVTAMLQDLADKGLLSA